MEDKRADEPSRRRHRTKEAAVPGGERNVLPMRPREEERAALWLRMTSYWKKKNGDTRKTTRERKAKPQDSVACRDIRKGRSARPLPGHGALKAAM